MRLSVCMIVKDEEAALPRCLRSVQDVADEIVVVDTGSTDKTIETAKSFGAKVISHLWDDDFAKARNIGLDSAEGEWILIMDADEELVVEDIPYLERILANSQFEVHTFMLVDSRGLEIHPQTRLWKNKPEYRYSGKIHEQMAPELPGTAENIGAHTAVRLLHYGYESSTIAAKDKRTRNLELLLEELENNPEDVRVLFHLGHHFDWPQELDKAIPYYKKGFELDRGGAMPILALKYGAALEKLGRYEESATVIRIAVKERFPDYTDLHFTLGRVYLKVGKPDEALKSFERCLKMGNSFKYPSVMGTGGDLALLMYGHTLAQLRRSDEANRVLSAALKQIRQSPTSLLYLGKLYQLQFSPAEAQRQLTQIADLSKDPVKKTFSLLFGDSTS